MNNAESFKDKYYLSYPAKIPLDLILTANDYSIVRHKSTNRSIVLKNENDGHIVIASKLPNGDYLYFNPQDDRDKGNIYSFCKHNNRDIKELLANFFEKPIERDYQINHQVKSTNDDVQKEREHIVKHFKSLKRYSTKNNFYLQNRSIANEVIENYNNNIRVDSHHNVYFPQYKMMKPNSDSKETLYICGYTMKLSTPIYTKNGIMLEKPIKQISKGQKGLEILMPNSIIDENRVIVNKTKEIHAIVSESSIDNLSFAEIANLNDNAILIASAGNISKEILESSLKEIDSNFNIKEYFLCFDNDEAGERLKESFKEIGFKLHLKMFNTKPLTKDYNDDLKLFKMLKINESKDKKYISHRFGDFIEGYFNNITLEQCKNSVEKAIRNVFNDFKYAKDTFERHKAMKTLRSIDKKYKIPSDIRKEFNRIAKLKDKRILEL